MKVWFRALVIFLMLIYQNVEAVEVQGLYEVEIIAKSEQEQDKSVAIKDAMQRLLGRIMAGKNTLQDNIVNNVWVNAENYVSEYQLSLSEMNHQDARLMRILFNEKQLENALRLSQFGLWNEIRPRTLLRLVVEENGKQQFFDADTMPWVDRALQKASKQKKIPILLPMQDLRDKQVLAVGDVLSAYSEYLLEASVRYEVVSTLAGKLVKSHGCWKAEWTLYFDAKIEQWRSTCSSLNNATLQGFQGIYDRLSIFYAAKHKVKSVDGIIVKVSGIKRIAEKEHVRDYLEVLPMIRTATWLGAGNGYNRYRVFYQGKRSDLIKRLASTHVLKAESFLKQSEKEISYQFFNH